MSTLINISNEIAAFAVMLSLFLGVVSMAMGQQPSEIKNIVLVHGAFVDGSGWKDVYQILTGKGYEVTVTQNSLSSLEVDVEILNKAIERHEGPVILVGHSYGGAIITQGGNSDKVAGLVYVAAFALDKGESIPDLGQRAPDLSNGGILPADKNGIHYYDKAKFHEGFAGDLPKEQADFMYASQGIFTAKALEARVTEPAWKTKPSWAVLATEDKSVNPIVQRFMYERAGAVITEVKGSHAVFISQPEEVAKVIEDAAKGVATIGIGKSTEMK